MWFFHLEILLCSLFDSLQSFLELLLETCRVISLLFSSISLSFASDKFQHFLKNICEFTDPVAVHNGLFSTLFECEGLGFIFKF